MTFTSNPIDATIPVEWTAFQSIRKKKMNGNSDDRAKIVLFLMALAIVGVVAVVVLGQTLRHAFFGVHMNDILTVRIQGPGEERAEFAVTVRDIMPNGELLIANHRRIRTGNDIWTVSLSGRLRSSDIQPIGYIDSEDVMDFVLHKTAPVDKDAQETANASD